MFLCYESGIRALDFAKFVCVHSVCAQFVCAVCVFVSSEMCGGGDVIRGSKSRLNKYIELN